jgi:outer membrane receptor protein involved in Fe transport
VLLNGRRFVTGLTGRVDLNNIPVAVIKRIEILKDGASAIYGSDAISGVVNIITRDDFEGMQANATFGQFESENDGEIQSYDFSVGTTSDRGSVFFSASYYKAEDVLAGDREISDVPQFGTGNAFGSSGTPQGRFCIFNTDFGSCGLTTSPGSDIASQGTGAFFEGDFSFGAPGDGGDRFNFAPDNYLLTPQERTNVFTQATYEVTDDVRMSVEASFNNRISSQLLAPTPLFIGCCGFGSSLIGVAADNIYNPFGALPASSWGLGRRMVEAGTLTAIASASVSKAASRWPIVTSTGT